MSKQSLIDLCKLKKVFYTEELETLALNNIHLHIDRGEYVSVSGPSGCGKSTLLSMIGLLDTPTEGEYTFDGVNVAKLNANQRATVRNRQIGFVFQAFNLIGDMDVSENVELPLQYRKNLTHAERKRYVHLALDQVNMTHRVKHFPAQLSGGQQQRVAIARALAGKPQVLLADEPTGNLDSKNAAMVMDLLDNLHQQGKTIVMVTHSAEHAARAKRQIDLFDGAVLDDRDTGLSAYQPETAIP